MYSNYFSAFVDGTGGIHVQEINGTRQIGVSLEKFREVESVANDALAKVETYYKQLVDAGIIKPKLTAEDQLAALTQQVAILTDKLSKMTPQGVEHELCGPRQSVSAER